MAEMIGPVSAVVSLVELSGKILSLDYEYLSKVSMGPTEVRLLRYSYTVEVLLVQ